MLKQPGRVISTDAIEFSRIDIIQPITYVLVHSTFSFSNYHYLETETRIRNHFLSVQFLWLESIQTISSTLFQIDIFDLFSHSLDHCFSPFPMSTYGNCPHNFWQFDIFYAGGNDRINISFLYKFKQPFMFLHHFFSKRIGFELGCIADLRNWSLMLFILSLFREQFWVSEKCLMDRQY